MQLLFRFRVIVATDHLHLLCFDQGDQVHRDSSQQLFLVGSEPPPTLRQEKEYLYCGHFFPCTPWPFSCSTALLSVPQSRSCTTGDLGLYYGLAWRPPLYLCTPSLALGSQVVAYLVTSLSLWHLACNPTRPLQGSLGPFGLGIPKESPGESPAASTAQKS